MKKTLKARIEINQENEIELKIGADYTINKDYDDIQVWGELELNSTWIENIEIEQAEQIINGKITCFSCESLEEIDTSIEWLFGDEKDFIKCLKEYINENN